MFTLASAGPVSCTMWHTPSIHEQRIEGQTGRPDMNRHPERDSAAPSQSAGIDPHAHRLDHGCLAERIGAPLHFSGQNSRMDAQLSERTFLADGDQCATALTHRVRKASRYTRQPAAHSIQNYKRKTATAENFLCTSEASPLS
jgi:hypothetical protein